MLSNQPLDDGVAHAQRARRLVQTEPLSAAPVIRQTAPMPHALDVMHAPGTALAGAIPKTVQHLSNGGVITDLGQLGEQLDRLLVGHVPGLSGAVTSHMQLGVYTALPVDPQHVLRRRLVGRVHHDLLDHRTQDPLLQLHRSRRMMPR